MKKKYSKHTYRSVVYVPAPVTKPFKSSYNYTHRKV